MNNKYINKIKSTKGKNKKQSIKNIKNFHNKITPTLKNILINIALTYWKKKNKQNNKDK